MTSPVSAVEAIERALEGVTNRAAWSVEGYDDDTGQANVVGGGFYIAGVIANQPDQEATAKFIAACNPVAITALLALARQAEELERAINSNFCVVFLDGRNEHGTHVLPSFPASFDADQDDIADQAEAIMKAAEDAGFQEDDHVWAEFSWQSPQIDNEGRTELAGYWDFTRINPSMSQLINRRARTLLKEEANAE